MADDVEVPEDVRRKADALGAVGRRWLDRLGPVLAELEQAWAIVVGPALPGGSSGLVAAATTADGTPVVVKVAIPDGLVGNSPFDAEVTALRLADGRGYVRLLRADGARRALLLERLGRPLSELGLPVDRQVDAIASTVRRAWRPAPPTTRLRTGVEQADFLAGFILDAWTGLGRPCPAATVTEAQRFLAARRAAFDPDTAVLVHGDAHPGNVLTDLDGSTGTFKLIDPDAMVSEPAHDLAFALRDWTGELLAGEAVSLGRRWCNRLADVAGVDASPVWQWAFVERVSTGLFLLRLGDGRGHQLLDVATSWVGAGPDDGDARRGPRPSSGGTARAPR